MDKVKVVQHGCHEQCGNVETIKCLLYLEAALIVICLFAPFHLGEGSLFNQRFPWVILLLGLPLMNVPARFLSARFTMGLLFFVATLFTGINSVALYQKSLVIESFLGGLSLDLPKGAMMVTYKSSRDDFLTDVLLHAVSHYGILKGLVDIGNYEARLRLFPVRYKDTMPAVPSYNQIAYETETIDWSRFNYINYIFAWEQDNTSLGRVVEFYGKIFDNGRLTVWRRR